MNEAIQLLLALQNYDMRLIELERILCHIPQAIADLETTTAQWNQKITQEKEQIQNTKLEIQKLEKEISSSEEIITTYKYKLAFTKNPRESENLTKKIEDERNKMSQWEELSLHKMFELDDKKIKLSISEQAAQNEILKIQNEREYEQQQIVNLEKNKTEIQNKIAAMRKILQENHDHWLYHYDKTKKAIHKMPCVVELRSGNFCGGCHLKLSDYNNQTSDPRFPFMICESCARMIVAARGLRPLDSRKEA
jgi:predicted  nucleic acid-binding Zn-ribbon protein